MDAEQKLEVSEAEIEQLKKQNSQLTEDKRYLTKYKDNLKKA